MEILAPAGSMESLRAAVMSGADAVYLGGKSFSARSKAKNFDNEELESAMEFAHDRGVRVYVAVNTVIKQDELYAALELVEFLCGIGADAVLVQDLGLLSLIRRCAPELAVHASTQMGVGTSYGVRLLESMGLARVVLPRELSLKEIEELRKRTSMELEVFVHGALCMSVSGQCYFSAALGTRSGNRGGCAQPCRLPFKSCFGGGDEFTLSLKDLSFIGSIKSLESAGVCCVKIEGRLKRPEYVAAAVTACRQALRGELSAELSKSLEDVFSRSGFTDGYLTGKIGAGMRGVRTVQDVSRGKDELFLSLRDLYVKQEKKTEVSLRLSLCADGLVIVEGSDGRNKAAATTFEDRRNYPPLSAERCRRQMGKLGETIYFAGEIICDDEPCITVASLNAMRREVTDKLAGMRIDVSKPKFKNIKYIPPVRDIVGKAKLYAAFLNASQVCEQAKLVEGIYLPLFTPIKELVELRKRGFRAIRLEIPRGFFGKEQAIYQEVIKKRDAGFTELVCNGIDAVAICRELGVTIHGAYGMNITNSASLDAFANMGGESAELSFELSQKEIEQLGSKIQRGIAVYGRLAIMLTKNCPAATQGKCSMGKCPQYNGSDGYAAISDRMGVKFPVLCKTVQGEKMCEVFNSVPLYLGDRLEKIKGIDFAVARFTVEAPAKCAEIIDRIIRRKPLKDNYTRGRIQSAVE